MSARKQQDYSSAFKAESHQHFTSFPFVEQNNQQYLYNISRPLLKPPPPIFKLLVRICKPTNNQNRMNSFNQAGLATFRFSLTPVFKHIISVQLKGSIIFPLTSDLAYSTPRSSAAVDKQILLPSPNETNLARTISPGMQHSLTLTSSVIFSLMCYLLIWPYKCWITRISFCCRIFKQAPSYRILNICPNTTSPTLRTTAGCLRFFTLIFVSYLPSSALTFSVTRVPKQEAYSWLFSLQTPGPGRFPSPTATLAPGTMDIIIDDNEYQLCESPAEEYLIQCINILIQILLSLAQNPFLEITEVEFGLVAPGVLLQPFYVKLEVGLQLVLVEDPVYHMTAEQLKFQFVFYVTLQLFVFTDPLENVRSGRTVWNFKGLEVGVLDVQGQFLFEVFYWNAFLHTVCLTIGVFKFQFSFEAFLFEIVEQDPILLGSRKFAPVFQLILKEDWGHNFILQFAHQGPTVMYEGPEHIVPDSHPFLCTEHAHQIEIIGAFPQIRNFAHLEARSLDLLGEHFVCGVQNHLLGDELRTGFVLGLESLVRKSCLVEGVRVHDDLFLVVFAVVLQLVPVWSEQRVTYKHLEGHSFAAVDNEYSTEEVLQLGSYRFELVNFSDHILHVESVPTLPINIGQQIMPLKWILCEHHEIQKNSQCPNIHRLIIGRILQNFRRHVLLGSANGTGST